MYVGCPYRCNPFVQGSSSVAPIASTASTTSRPTNSGIVAALTIPIDLLASPQRNHLATEGIIFTSTISTPTRSAVLPDTSLASYPSTPSRGVVASPAPPGTPSRTPSRSTALSLSSSSTSAALTAIHNTQPPSLNNLSTVSTSSSIAPVVQAFLQIPTEFNPPVSLPSGPVPNAEQVRRAHMARLPTQNVGSGSRTRSFQTADERRLDVTEFSAPPPAKRARRQHVEYLVLWLVILPHQCSKCQADSSTPVALCESHVWDFTNENIRAFMVDLQKVGLCFKTTFRYTEDSVSLYQRIQDAITLELQSIVESSLDRSTDSPLWCLHKINRRRLAPYSTHAPAPELWKPNKIKKDYKSKVSLSSEAEGTLFFAPSNFQICMKLDLPGFNIPQICLLRPEEQDKPLYKAVVHDCFPDVFMSAYEQFHRAHDNTDQAYIARSILQCLNFERRPGHATYYRAMQCPDLPPMQIHGDEGVLEFSSTNNPLSEEDLQWSVGHFSPPPEGLFIPGSSQNSPDPSALSPDPDTLNGENSEDDTVVDQFPIYDRLEDHIFDVTRLTFGEDPIDVCQTPRRFRPQNYLEISTKNPAMTGQEFLRLLRHVSQHAYVHDGISWGWNIDGDSMRMKNVPAFPWSTHMLNPPDHPDAERALMSFRAPRLVTQDTTYDSRVHRSRESYGRGVTMQIWTLLLQQAIDELGVTLEHRNEGNSRGSKLLGIAISTVQPVNRDSPLRVRYHCFGMIVALFILNTGLPPLPVSPLILLLLMADRGTPWRFIDELSIEDIKELDMDLGLGLAPLLDDNRTDCLCFDEHLPGLLSNARSYTNEVKFLDQHTCWTPAQREKNWHPLLAELLTGSQEFYNTEAFLLVREGFWETFTFKSVPHFLMTTKSDEDDNDERPSVMKNVRDLYRLASPRYQRAWDRVRVCSTLLTPNEVKPLEDAIKYYLRTHADRNAAFVVLMTGARYLTPHASLSFMMHRLEGHNSEIKDASVEIMSCTSSARIYFSDASENFFRNCDPLFFPGGLDGWVRAQFSEQLSEVMKVGFTGG
ncbi:hypothetical protein VNI00_019090 [Paramarasmius palmivorus]|uniref:Uncharacterized protein n=1 Tax=Paramarasmius palmivorus TaxID=297713 RepID=A0AAW0ASS3_9AGAR